MVCVVDVFIVALRYLHNGFEDVVWIDKSTVQLETVFAIVKTWADVSTVTSIS